jgi:hypothetical protein
MLIPDSFNPDVTEGMEWVVALEEGAFEVPEEDVSGLDLSDEPLEWESGAEPVDLRQHAAAEHDVTDKPESRLPAHRSSDWMVLGSPSVGSVPLSQAAMTSGGPCGRRRP